MAQPNRINHEPVFLLASAPWRESSLWVEAFSRRYGRVALLARSARKRQSELRGVLVPFVPVSASWYGSQELKTLHRAEWIGGWPQPQGQGFVQRIVCERVDAEVDRPRRPVARALRCFGGNHETICCEANHIAALRRFEWTLLTRLGFAPDLFHDGNGNEINGEETYWLTPEEAVVPLAEADRFHALNKGVAVLGATLIDLREGSFVHQESSGRL